MHVSRAIFKLLLLLLFFGSTHIQSQIAPDWLQNRPQLPDYYIGIAFSTIAGKSESTYRQEADDMALLELSKQIRTSVWGESQDIFSQVDLKAKEKFEEISGTFTAADLEGLELVDSHLSPTEYWVYWRLSKSTHRQNINKYEDQALASYNRAIDLSERAVIGQLSFLVKSYESLIRAQPKPVYTMQSGRTILLNAEIPQMIEKIFSSIQLSGHDLVRNARTGDRLEEPLIVNARWSPPNSISPTSLRGLTVLFQADDPTLRLQPVRMTDRNGNGKSSVGRIRSNQRNINVTATINLKSFKLSDAPLRSLDIFLDELANKKSVDFSILLGGLLSEKIAIKVFSEKGIPPLELKYLNEELIASMKRLTNFRVIELNQMEEILQEQDFQHQNCSTAECQVQIGKLLSVRKMVFARLWIIEGQFRGTLKLLDVSTGENEHTESVRFKGTINELADNGIPEWTKNFYSNLNKTNLSLTSSVSNVEVSYNGKYWDKLPIWEKKLDAGNYEFIVSSPGYENRKLLFTLRAGEKVDEPVELTPKSKKRAFIKSMGFPGRGQFYASDRQNASRRTMGLVFSTAGAFALTSTALGWINYQDARDLYNTSYSSYMNAEVATEIENAREKAKSDHQSMIDVQSTVTLLTTLTAAIWIGNALEAVISFPKYDLAVGPEGGTLNLSLVNNYGQIKPSISYKVPIR